MCIWNEFHHLTRSITHSILSVPSGVWGVYKGLSCIILYHNYGILAQQWLQYLIICGGDQTPNTVFENQLKIYCIRYSEWVLCNNNLEIQKCEGIIFVHSNKFDVKRALSLNFWENLCWKTYKLCIIKSYQRGQARFDINSNVAIECIYVVTLKLRSLCIIWSKCEQNAAKIKASALWR